MGTFRDLLAKTFAAFKSPFNYQSHKYEDIKPESIIHQGHLQYLYHTTMLGESSFRMYLVVLTRLSIEKLDEIFGVYLFPDEKKCSTYFFLIDPKTKVNDRCNQYIRPLPKFFLMELKFAEKDKVEIFGAKDNLERQTWVHVMRNLFPSARGSRSESVSAYLMPKPLDEPMSQENAVVLHDDISFTASSRSMENVDMDQKRRINPTDRELSPISIDLSLADPSSAEPLQQTQSPFVFDSCEKKFLWDDIFYSNVDNDAKYILARTGQIGAFLIRPQSKKSNSSDQQYTLCVYFDVNSIRCFTIYPSPKRKSEYTLTIKGCENFVDMITLCEYYCSNPLPTSANNFYLKKPYKFYPSN